jgi:hypothetical protein
MKVDQTKKPETCVDGLQSLIAISDKGDFFELLMAIVHICRKGP